MEIKGKRKGILKWRIVCRPIKHLHFLHGDVVLVTKETPTKRHLLPVIYLTIDDVYRRVLGQMLDSCCALGNSKNLQGRCTIFVSCTSSRWHKKGIICQAIASIQSCSKNNMRVEDTQENTVYNPGSCKSNNR